MACRRLAHVSGGRRECSLSSLVHLLLGPHTDLDEMTAGQTHLVINHSRRYRQTDTRDAPV